MQKIFIKYQNNITTTKVSNLGDYVTFVKGKKPLEIVCNLRPYLNIEGMESNAFEYKCANGMITSNKDELLMVMDGASSGTIYSGFEGIVGSTLAKLVISPQILTPIIEQKIIEMNTKIKELNTGSAIPHANKEFISSITLQLDNGYETEVLIEKLKLLKNKILKLKDENVLLNNLKSLYLKKFFN
jgi:type I restriction enzyme S subunit